MALQVSLRSLVTDQYGSIAKFAENLGWSYSKAYRVVSGEQEINTGDIRNVCEALGIVEPEDIVSVFSLSNRLQTGRG